MLAMPRKTIPDTHLMKYLYTLTPLDIYPQNHSFDRSLRPASRFSQHPNARVDDILATATCQARLNLVANRNQLIT